MLKPFLIQLSAILSGLFVFSSCSRSGSFVVENFDPITNYSQKNNNIDIQADLSDAVINGIEIPTKKQTSNGFFKFTFNVKNTSSEIKKYYYKIFYQNESYKHVDTTSLSHENF